ncbi:branched-chain amino acid aminotransferase II [Cristinia sonorae]|uniref:Branched-chain-amino-acid aminotransferase n=1 Tax=Cristinia sonorae TaxID=1940300 RepID=A0A8K0UQ39_9AGAR|nr:branched-chain amino acid aminotransferase II [Cristinia sonorae]
MTVKATNGAALGSAPTQAVVQKLQDVDASKVVVTLAESLKPVPPPEELVFGQTFTDHMVMVTYDPVNGWGTPEIKPYGPISLDPASSIFQYSTSAFEGMKAYVGPDGKPRLFRPELNMLRMKRSTARIALPAFDADELLKLIKKLVALESRWIPNLKGHSLYIRPTIIGTRPSIGVRASDHAILYVICCPTGPYFRTGPKPVSLLAVGEQVRSWPGGTGEFKLSINYTPTFHPQQLAAEKGYDQCLWLLGEDSHITEAGAMNFFVVVKRDDDHLDVYTPPLDGTILPGLTRASVLTLAAAHPGQTTLPYLPHTLKLHTHERLITMTDLFSWHASGHLTEIFLVGTAAVVATVGRVGFGDKVLEAPKCEGGLGPVARALYDRLTDIQEGKVEFQGWSVPIDA